MSQLHSAADTGKKAWMPGTTSAEGDAAVRSHLNKLHATTFACVA